MSRPLTILSDLGPDEFLRSREDAYELAEAGIDVVPALLRAASDLRRFGKGDTVSYSRKVFLPITRVCRNRCGYCGFRREPADAPSALMGPEEVLALVRRGAEAGCKEALLTCGERPEEIAPVVRQRLRQLGFTSSVEYVRYLAHLILDQTGLLPHSNLGVVSREELAELKPVNASLGLMLETTSRRLLEPGGPHAASPGKDPRARLRVLEEAGELRVPFTTGILIGIGERPRDRVDALFFIRDIHRRHGHIQEVIIQNFRAQPGTPMAGHPEPTFLEMLKTIALARVILGPEMNIQAPPNLSQDGYQGFLLAGLNDWGGISPVTPDFINPRSPWPEIMELMRQTRAAGFRLRERLAVYPEYITKKSAYIVEPLRERVLALVDREGYVKGRDQHA